MSDPTEQILDAVGRLVDTAAEAVDQTNSLRGPTKKWQKEYDRALRDVLGYALGRTPTASELERADTL